MGMFVTMSFHIATDKKEKQVFFQGARLELSYRFQTWMMIPVRVRYKEFFVIVKKYFIICLDNKKPNYSKLQRILLHTEYVCLYHIHLH